GPSPSRRPWPSRRCPDSAVRDSLPVRPDPRARARSPPVARRRASRRRRSSPTKTRAIARSADPVDVPCVRSASLRVFAGHCRRRRTLLTYLLIRDRRMPDLRRMTAYGRRRTEHRSGAPNELALVQSRWALLNARFVYVASCVWVRNLLPWAHLEW